MNVSIDNLSLRLTGVPEADGARLANLVADGLARVDAAGAYSIGALTIHAGAQPGERMERLAEKIVHAVAAQIHGQGGAEAREGSHDA